MPIEYYICLLMYSFIVLFIGWCIGERDGRKKAKDKIDRLKTMVNLIYGKENNND